MRRRCLDCEYFKDKSYFPHTGGTSGKCYNPKSPKYGRWMVGAWGCEVIIEEGELFDF